MNTSEIISAIDQELARLQSARALLLGTQQTPEVKKPGRPKGVKNAPTAAKTAAASGGAPKKRVMSAEGKARIAAAQKARWAKQHADSNAPAKKSSAKKAAKKAAVKTAEA